MKRRISLKQGRLFFSQMAAVTASGMPLSSCLEILESRFQAGVMRQLAHDLSQAVDRGGFLSEGFEKWKNSLLPVVPPLVRMGESTGRLDLTFQTVSGIYATLADYRSRIITSLLYPVFVLVLGILIIPFPRLILSGFGDYLRALALPVSVAAIGTACVIGIRNLKKRSPAVDDLISGIAIHIPVLGKVIRQSESARFSMILAVAIDSGMDTMTSLQLAANAVTNSVMRTKIQNAARRVSERGDTLSEAFRDLSEFPEMFHHMILAGEKSGNITEMLHKAEQIFQEESRTTMTRFAILLGPVIFILLAIYFGYYIIQFWSGYFGNLDSLNQM